MLSPRSSKGLAAIMAAVDWPVADDGREWILYRNVGLFEFFLSNCFCLF